MRNRAKCRLCQSVIESFHRYDYVSCKCGEISIDGGNEYFKASALNWNNFLRVDDQDNEIVPKIIEKDAGEDMKKEDPNVPQVHSREDLLNMLDELIISFDNLPKHARLESVTNQDLQSVLSLFSSIFRA